MGKILHKKTCLQGYYISGDYECWCLAKDVTDEGIAVEPSSVVLRQMNHVDLDDEDEMERISTEYAEAREQHKDAVIYPDDLFPDTENEYGVQPKQRYNITVIVELEEVDE